MYGTEQYNTKNKTAQKIQHETHRQNSNYIVRFQGEGAGGRREKADICVAEEMNCNESEFEFEMC